MHYNYSGCGLSGIKNFAHFNNAMGWKGKLTNKLASLDACKEYMYACVYMKCGHNINWEILQIHTNKHKYVLLMSNSLFSSKK